MVSTKERITRRACPPERGGGVVTGYFRGEVGMCYRGRDVAVCIWSVFEDLHRRGIQCVRVFGSFGTYALPRAKMALMFWCEVCSCQTMGMGSRRAVFRTVLMMARLVRDAMRSMQRPTGSSENIPPSDLQSISIGQHWKTVVKDPATAQPIWRAGSVYKLHANIRLRVVKARL